VTDWIIDRLELAFFNTLDSRWQLFQEGTIKPSGHHYRWHVSQLLQNVRSSFANASLKHFKIKEYPSFDNQLLVLNNKFNDQEQGFLDQVIQSIRKNADREGLKKEPFDVLTNWKSGTSIKLPPNIALEALSLLPIRKPWDIFGTLGFPDERHLALATQVHENDVFAYSISWNSAREMPEDIGELTLGYRVDLEIAVPDNDAVIFDGDYFKGCHDIHANHKLDYRFYGYWVDECQRQIHSRTEPRSKVHVLVYPLMGCGWPHFLLIYISPNEGNSSLPQLIKHWGSDFNHNGAGRTIIPWQGFAEALEDSLVEARIMAFQNYILQDIRSELLKQSDPGSVGGGRMLWHRIFSQHIHNIARVKRARMQGNNTQIEYCYDKDEVWKECELSSDSFLNWKRVNPSIVPGYEIYEVILDLPQEGASAVHDAVINLTLQRLSNQYQWSRDQFTQLNQMVNDADKMRKSAEDLKISATTLSNSAEMFITRSNALIKSVLDK
jgi:hypothetical protein